MILNLCCPHFVQKWLFWY